MSVAHNTTWLCSYYIISRDFQRIWYLFTTGCNKVILIDHVTVWAVVHCSPYMQIFFTNHVTLRHCHMTVCVDCYHQMSCDQQYWKLILFGSPYSTESDVTVRNAKWKRFYCTVLLIHNLAVISSVISDAMAPDEGSTCANSLWRRCYFNSKRKAIHLFSKVNQTWTLSVNSYTINQNVDPKTIFWIQLKRLN